jgi:predicted acylesterase/phospholipase RssA
MITYKNNPSAAEKRSLILAGGGMRVAYQAGVLLALEESDIKFTHVDGTSGGIFNTAMLASGLSAKDIAERWRTLKMKNFVSRRKFNEYLNPLFMEGYADADNIRHKVFPHLGINIQAIRQNKSINATFNVCNFSNKTIESIGNQEVQEDHLIAAVSLPIFMPALQIGEDWYTDAVWIKDANLLEGVRQKSKELWLIWAIGNTRTYLPGAFNQYVHMIEMSSNGALLEEYKQINKINSDLKQGSGEYAQDPIKLMVIKSTDPLPLDPDLFFNKINTRELINMGYENAKSYLIQGYPARKMDENATKNDEIDSVLSFRATFKGNLKWNFEKTNIIYYVYCRFKLFGGHQKLSLYSSIYTGSMLQEIPAYDHKVVQKKHKDFTLLEISAKLLINKEEYYLKSIVRMYSPLEILLGLGMKKVTLTIGKWPEAIDTPVLQGDLYQSASDRLKSVFFSSVKTGKGKAGGLGKRLSLLLKLFENEKPNDFPSTQDVNMEKRIHTNP